MVDALRADEDEIVRARNPFLETNEVRLVPLRVLDLMNDTKFKGYYQRRLKELAEEVVDWEVVRICDDLLRERANDIASRHLGRCQDAAGSMRSQGVLPAVLDAFPPDLQLDAVTLERILQGLMKRDDVNGEVVRLGKTLGAVEQGIAAEVNRLRTTYPMCVRDVNPAVEFDETFQRLENERRSLLERFTKTELIESLEKEERKQSVELLDDERYVAAAAEACRGSSGKHTNEMTEEELTARWRHHLLARRARRRVVTFLDVTQEERETAREQERERRRSVHQRKKKRSGSSASCSNLSFSEVPDNVFIEIKEEDLELSPTLRSKRTSRIFSDGTSHSEVPTGSEGEESSHVSGKRIRRSLQLRRLRAHRFSGGLAVDAIPDLIAYQIAEDGTVSQVVDGAVSGDEGSMTFLSPPRTTAPGLAIPLPLPPPPTKGEGKKKKKLVLRKRPRLRRGPANSVSQLTMSAVPELTAGELVEQGTESLDSAGLDVHGSSAALHRLKKPPAQQPVKKMDSSPQRQAKKHRKSANVSLTMTAVPDVQGLFIPEEVPEVPPPPLADRNASVGEPDIKTKPRRRGTGRGPEVLTALTEEPGELQEPREDQRQSPLSAVLAHSMMLDVRTHDLSLTALPPPPPLPQSLPKIVGMPASAPTAAEASVANGAVKRRGAKRPDGKKRRVKKPKEHKGSLIVSRLEDDRYGEIPDTMENELSAGSPRGDVSHVEATPEAKRPARRGRSLQRHHESISQVQENEVSCIQDDVKGNLAAKTSRRRCSFDLSSIIPINRREGREMERERRFISGVLNKARQLLSRHTTVEEIESDTKAMELVFKHEDISQVFAMRRVDIGDAYLKEIAAAALQRVIEMSKEPVSAGATARALAAREARRQELVKRAAATISGNKSNNVNDDAADLDVNNPRCVPQPWAHLTDDELAQDVELHAILDSRSKTDGKGLATYLREWSKRKESENEVLFNEYPFLPPLPHGVPLTEVGFVDDPEFQRRAVEYSLRRGDEKLQRELCDIVDRLAKQRAILRNRGKAKHLSVVQRVRAACGAGAADAARRSSGNEATEAMRAQMRSKFRDEHLRLQFITQCKQDSTRLLKRLMVRMKRERTADTPLSIEDIETFRFFFDGVDVGNFGVLDRIDFVEFAVLTVSDVATLTRRDVERLTFPNTPVERLPQVVDFSDFSKFYKALALQEVKQQDSRFLEEPQTYGRQQLGIESPRPQRSLSNAARVTLPAISQQTRSQSTVVVLPRDPVVPRRPATTQRLAQRQAASLSLPPVAMAEARAGAGAGTGTGAVAAAVARSGIVPQRQTWMRSNSQQDDSDTMNGPNE
ncbi:hypothetical protein DQ04_03591040 [Trypanosoma grayi]|uniref:hypothetical protein n=1 Tax=Trypanosoma grayi TaxID=71804 RepID=UPI0004F422EC|nr:hypothetical protein DQ04_03591040 [Trypanosoma grayi]KEG10549.1 hypothetical protein DQ04_03591040 [Trypanosoma grayi]